MKRVLRNVAERLDTAGHRVGVHHSYLCLAFDVVNGWDYHDPGFPRNPVTWAIWRVLR